MIDRVVVVGATGNVGTAVMRALDAHAGIASVVGVARRPPLDDLGLSQRISWRTADIASDDLSFVADADTVIHLAWMIQPQRHEPMMRRTNVDGTRRLVDAVASGGVRQFVYASSVGT